MSLNTEKIEAQRIAFQSKTLRGLRHLIAPAELEMILLKAAECDRLRRNEFTCLNCGLRQDGEGTAGDV